MEYRLFDLIQMAETFATEYHIPPDLLCAIINVESEWNRWAVRYEPAFLKKYILPLKLKSKTEQVMRACSFGLGQILGQSAIERGFHGDLPKLFCPQVNIEYVCKYIEMLKRRKDYSWNDVISAYNQGNKRKNKSGEYKNKRYVAKVNGSREEYEKDNPMVC